MDITSDNPEHGFQFPGVFEITAMGPADAGLEAEIPRVLGDAGITVLGDSVSTRASSGGRYVSVKCSVQVESRAQYDAAHLALRAHPAIKWTL